MTSRLFTILLCLLAPELLPGQPANKALKAEALAAKVKPSVVSITASDRQGRLGGNGTGFIVRKDGVIASNFHVIGQHREFRIRLADGRKLHPVRILAVDRKRDLALIQVEADNLPVLPLGDSDTARPGQPILTLGNPLGFEFSVSRGVIAATDRELAEQKMLQVAVPLEPGSSGSPVLNRHGEVLGVLGIKSGSAMGFAVPVNQLKSLLENPRPIAIDAWLTIGQLDPTEWKPIMGADWRQRAGIISCTGSGEGFGGRTVCLSQATPPQATWEAEVEVRLEDESGAAGLVFCHDTQGRNYGFYPTAGSLRLTRFDGPDVYSWHIIETVPSDVYRPGDWNRIHVRVETNQVICRVNGQEVIKSTDRKLKTGRIGLVKFRQPAAEFRRFRLGKKLQQPPSGDALAKKLDALLNGNNLPNAARLANLDGPVGDLLKARARAMEAEAEQLRHLARAVHRRKTVQVLAALVETEKFDLLHATLLLARLDNPELDIDYYLKRVDRMAATARERLEGKKGEARLQVLLDYLFVELSYHGSSGDYYDRSNSYLNEVIEDREGIPITLTVLLMEIGRRAGVTIRGVGIPRHFVGMHGEGKHRRLIDAFDGGKRIGLAEASELSGFQISNEDLVASTSRDILLRMLANLLNVAEMDEDQERVLGYLDAALALNPQEPRYRGMRAMLLAGAEQFDAALKDLDFLLANPPKEFDRRMIEQLHQRIQRARDAASK